MPVIWVEGNLWVKNLTIYDVHRVEENIPIETVRVDEAARVDNLTIHHLYERNMERYKAHRVERTAAGANERDLAYRSPYRHAAGNHRSRETR